MRRAEVWFDREFAGWLDERPDGTRFQYVAAWLATPHAQPISLTLPLREQPYESPSVPPFFLGLLPEGWLLDLALSKLKLSRDDPFGLLLALCRDCAGAVWIREGEPADA